MALCATPLENSSFFACQSEKKSLKRFSNFTSKKVFGHFLSSGKDKSRKSEVVEQPVDKTDSLHCKSDSFSSVEKRRPLVQNKENNFVNVFGEKIVISKKSLDGNISKRSLSPDHYHRYQQECDVSNHHHHHQQHISFNNMRKCYSNDISDFLNKSQLNKESNNLRMESPPRLLPFSGRLSCEKFKDVIKPIAFKPCSSYARKTASQDCILTQVNDEGYNSRNMSNSSAITSSSSSSSSNFFNENSQDAESAGSRHAAKQLRPRPKSSMLTSINNKKINEESRLANYRRLSVYHLNKDPLNVSICNNNNNNNNNNDDDNILNSPGLDVFQQHFVDMLEKKEKELHDLRDRMEANEKAMTAVFESKKEEWKVEVKEMEGKWQEKMRWHQQKAFRSEQSLLIQIMELRKENNFLKEKFNEAEKNVQNAHIERDEAQKSVDQLRTHLEEAHWQTSQKLDEIVSLRSQLNDNETTSVNNINRLRNKQRPQHVYETILTDDSSSHTHSCLDKHDDFVNHRAKCPSFPHPKSGDCLESILWSSNNTNTEETNSCSDDAFFRLGEVISQVEDLRKQSELQSHAWLFEKSKVIDYQKKLQTNYLEVCQKNQLLQDEVVRLRRKMEMSALDSIETESFC